MSATTCKLLSLNVRGIGNFKKRKTIFTWCRKQKADFIFLQETHSKIDSEKCWRNEWGGEIIMAHGSSNSRGVAILVKKDVDCTIHSKLLGPLGTVCYRKSRDKRQNVCFDKHLCSQQRRKHCKLFQQFAGDTAKK